MKNRTDYGYQVSISVLLLDILSARELKVLLHMKSLQEVGRQTVSISINTTAEFLGMGNRAVSKALIAFKKIGIIKEIYPAKRYKQFDGSYDTRPPVYAIRDWAYTGKARSKYKELAAEKSLGFRNFCQMRQKERNRRKGA
jgi:hypothetical protein